jgi:hypothetical protein
MTKAMMTKAMMIQTMCANILIDALFVTIALIAEIIHVPNAAIMSAGVINAVVSIAAIFVINAAVV